MMYINLIVFIALRMDSKLTENVTSQKWEKLKKCFF